MVIGVQCAMPGLRAHHATATQFDPSKTMKVTGVVSKLAWTNPHVHLALTVKTAGGREENWDVELGSPGAIIVSGLSRDQLEPGITLTITGYPGRASASPGSPALSVCATQVTLSDGTTAQFVVGI
jgi:hypothetical protein